LNDNFTDENKIALYLKHKPYIKLDILRKKQSPSNKELTIDDNELIIHLACIDYISKEGIYLLKKIVANKKLYIQFNHIQYHDSPQIYAWLFYKDWLFKVNVNELLVRKGYAKLGSFKSTDIYDEHIFYYHSDLIDAEEEAKTMGLGIWRHMRNKLQEYQSVFSRIIKFIRKRLNMNKWETHIYNK
jgi:hypothetical protein